MTGGGPLVERAPAKINLTLRVIGRRQDGFHLIESLVAFASVADELALDPRGTLGLRVSGPTGTLSGPVCDNLVIKASRALTARVPGLMSGHFHLLKRLPVAAGIGGGSSDAAAALRLLARANGLSLDDPRLMAAAATTGSDVPVCLVPTTRRMSGIGEILSAPIALPRLPAILVNPCSPVPTAAVFRALEVKGKPGIEADLRTGSRMEVIAGVAASANDLEAPAQTVSPLIGEVLDCVRSQPNCLVARMSGSGATVFGLFATCRQSASAAKAIRADRPDWWVRTTMIG